MVCQWAYPSSHYITERKSPHYRNVTFDRSFLLQNFSLWIMQSALRKKGSRNSSPWGAVCLSVTQPPLWSYFGATSEGGAISFSFLNMIIKEKNTPLPKGHHFPKRLPHFGSTFFSVWFTWFPRKWIVSRWPSTSEEVVTDCTSSEVFITNSNQHPGTWCHVPDINDHPEHRNVTSCHIIVAGQTGGCFQCSVILTNYWLLKSCHPNKEDWWTT